MNTARQDALNGASVKVYVGLRGQDKFLQPPEVEEALLHLLHHTVCGPLQIVSEVYAEDAFTFATAIPSMWMEVFSLCCLHDQHLHVVDVEGEVIFLAPLHQGPHFLPVGCLIIVVNQAYYCCVICKLDD